MRDTAELNGPAGFERALALRPGTDGGEGLTASPPPSFSIARSTEPLGAGSPNGGYLAALSALAASAGVTAPLRTLTVQFIASPAFAPLRFTAERLRAGRTAAFASVRAEQEGRTVLAALAGFGSAGSSPLHPAEEAPDAPPPEVAPELPLAAALLPHFAAHVEYRPAGGGLPLAGGPEALFRIWMRVKDGAPLSVARLLFLTDAVFPAFYAVTDRPWPSVTTDLRYDFVRPLDPGDAPDGWVLFEFRTRSWLDGWAVEDGRAWSRDGDLLILARQQRKVLASDARRAV